MRFGYFAIVISGLFLPVTQAPAQTAADPAIPLQPLQNEDAFARVSQDPFSPDRGLGKTPDDIGALLRQADDRVDSLFLFEPLQPLHDIWKPTTDHLRESSGLDLGLNYTSVYQRASRVRNGSKDAAGGDFDFFGNWLLWDHDDCGPGYLVFNTESRHRLDDIAPSALDTGTVGGTIVTFGRQDFSMVQLYWEQGSPDDGYLFRVGKMDPALIYDGGRYVSSNFAFYNPAFSDTLPMPLPGAGLGFAGAIYPTEETYIVAGVHDANGKRTTAGFDTFFDESEYFTAVEFGAVPNDGQPHEGLYHVTLWNIDSRQSMRRRNDRGIAVTLEQQVGCDGNVVPFLRYAYAHRGVNGIRQNLSVGVGIEEVFGQNYDLIGLAASWEEPSNQMLRDQYVLETFYRIQITPLTHLTPGVQVIFDPANAPGRDAVAVFGLRLRTLF